MRLGVNVKPKKSEFARIETLKRSIFGIVSIDDPNSTLCRSCDVGWLKRK